MLFLHYFHCLNLNYKICENPFIFFIRSLVLVGYWYLVSFSSYDVNVDMSLAGVACGSNTALAQ